MISKRRLLSALPALLLSHAMLATALAQPAAAPGPRPPFGRDPYEGKKKLLIWADVQSGFQHDSINHAIGVIEEMGRKSGAYVAFVRTDSHNITKGKVTASSARYASGNNNGRNLDYFDAIFFLGSGEGTLTAEQKKDLLAFIHDDGKGLIVGHAGTIAFYDWPEWGNAIGGFMQDGEYPATGMYATVTDPKWPGAAAFGSGSFLWTDQFPQLRPEFGKGSIHSIISLDAGKMTPAQRAKRSDDYFPIVWAKMYGKGRVFSMTAGHNDATYDDPKTQELTLEGIKWAMGIGDPDISPDK